MTLQDIKKTKCYGDTFVRTDGQMDNVKTVYPPTNTVCGRYNYVLYNQTALRSFKPGIIRICHEFANRIDNFSKGLYLASLGPAE